jgi:hypothetical protein
MLTEYALALQLGLSRDLIREARVALGIPKNLVKNQACVTAEAAEQIRGYLGATPSEKTAPAASQAQDSVTVVDDQPAAPLPGPVLTLRVLRTVLNPHIILATDGHGILRVRVRSSANFLPNMEIPVRHVQGDLYELARPCPRARGRW